MRIVLLSLGLNFSYHKVLFFNFSYRKVLVSDNSFLSEVSGSDFQNDATDSLGFTIC